VPKEKKLEIDENLKKIIFCELFKILNFEKKSLTIAGISEVTYIVFMIYNCVLHISFKG
jgi:hypothetical protein